VVWANRTGAKSIQDAKIKELVAGGVGASTAPTLLPRILNLIAGTKFKVVTAYPGTNDVQIAWERGEVDVLTTPWDTLLRRFEPQIRSGELVPLYVYGSSAPAGLEHLPLVNTKLGRTSGEKAFLDIYASAAYIGRSIATPPGVPAPQLAILRAAFERMVADNAFRAAVQKGNISLDPLSGNELSLAVRKTLKQSEQDISDARAVYDRILAQQ
jgi:tripartite-type tricarboxylate transporter receptor subunit TctC